MKFRQIETFYWAARLGSLAKAAKHLHATQSPVSMRIHELEKQLGVALFDRPRRSVRRSAHGASLLPLAEQIVKLMTRVTSLVREDSISGYVRLGVAEIIAHSWLARFPEIIRHDFPGVQVEIEVAQSHIIEAKLMDGNLDMAMVAFELPESRFVSAQLDHVEFRWMKSPSRTDIPVHIGANELATLPVILTSNEMNHRGSTLDSTNNSVRIVQPTICDTFTTAADLARTGLGMALLPSALYRDDVRSGALEIVTCSPPLQPLRLLCLRPRHEAVPAHAALEWDALTTSSFTGETQPEPHPEGGSGRDDWCSETLALPVRPNGQVRDCHHDGRDTRCGLPISLKCEEQGNPFWAGSRAK